MGKSFLGQGWKFPIEVDAITGKIKTSAYEEDIKESIQIILRTAKGERVMRPTFGCSISDYHFSVLDDTTMRLIETSIEEAIRVWEPRVHQVQIHMQRDQEHRGRLLIHIDYVVRTTNNLFNLVYPFYLHEGAK